MSGEWRLWYSWLASEGENESHSLLRAGDPSLFGRETLQLARVPCPWITASLVHKPRSYPVHYIPLNRFEIRSVSRPATPLAWLAQPVLRHYQAKFVRESLARMAQHGAETAAPG